jgi:hypothetical protein
MSQPLENYDHSSITIRVDPVNMYDVALNQIGPHSQNIVGSIEAIHRVWESLSVGWVGATAAEARQFGTEWVAAIRQLFGTEGDPGAGVLNRVIIGVVIATHNYDQAERVVIDMFSQMADSIAAAMPSEQS